MKYETISVGTSINPSTGDQWWKCDATVSVGKDENEDDVFNKVREKISAWLPNPYAEMKGTVVKPVEQEEKLSPEQQREKAINGHIQTILECKTLEHLVRFQTLVVRTDDERLLTAFNNRLKELQ